MTPLNVYLAIGFLLCLLSSIVSFPGIENIDLIEVFRILIGFIVVSLVWPVLILLSIHLAVEDIRDKKGTDTKKNLE